MDTEVAYLVCDFVPIDEFDSFASVSQDVFEGVRRYAEHKEIVSYDFYDGMFVFAGHKKSCILEKGNKYYGVADVIIECNGAILIIEDDKIYKVSLDYDGFNTSFFTQMTWGGYRKMDSNPGGDVKSIYYVTDIDCTLYYDEDIVYVRTDIYRGYTNDNEDAEAGEMEDHDTRQDLIKVWR